MYAVIKFDGTRTTATSIHNSEAAAWKRALKRAQKRAGRLGARVEVRLDGFGVETAVYAVKAVAMVG